MFRSPSFKNRIKRISDSPMHHSVIRNYLNGCPKKCSDIGSQVKSSQDEYTCKSIIAYVGQVEVLDQGSQDHD